MNKLATVELPLNATNTLEILAICQNAARLSGAGPEDTLDFLNEATTGDFEFALATVMKYFDVQLAE